ncbi:MAG: hypothetical protein OEW39_12840 [Deltaproteobacteria bacterium]|nr:hypothetical protein [Deltaproteobacteria bacterium]
MAAGVIASVVAPHTPRIGIEKNAPDFQRGLIEGLRAMGEEIRGLKPDLIVLLSAHWVSTFNWYVTGQAHHKGICIADEAPDLIPGVGYDRKGDASFARALSDSFNQNKVPCGVMDSPHFNWDYGIYVPLHYLDPEATIPLVAMPSVICSDGEECRRAGGVVHKTAREAGKRVVFVASCALAHRVMRGPELWPSKEHQALDHRFMDLVTQGNIESLAQWMPQYCREAVAEMDGRPVNGMVGAAQAMAQAGLRLSGKTFGAYAQSSGSGNASVGFFAA